MLLDNEVGDNREMGVIMGNVSVHSHSVYLCTCCGQFRSSRHNSFIDLISRQLFLIFSSLFYSSLINFVEFSYYSESTWRNVERLIYDVCKK